MVLAVICPVCGLALQAAMMGFSPRAAGSKYPAHAFKFASWFVGIQEPEGDRPMENNKPAQNIQDSFLNTARKERLNITIYLLSGVKLTGRIRSFDKYSVVLEANGQEQLIFKHAISTVVIGRSVPHGVHMAHAEAKVAGGTATPPQTVTAATASGTEG
jgi:host factor-I protein